MCEDIKLVAHEIVIILRSGETILFIVLKHFLLVCIIRFVQFNLFKVKLDKSN